VATRSSWDSNDEALHDNVDDDCFEDVSGELEDNSNSDAGVDDDDDDYEYDSDEGGDEGWDDE
jgi:hypothetical protein